MIVTSLDLEMKGVSDVLQLPPFEASSWQLKASEDMLNAVSAHGSAYAFSRDAPCRLVTTLLRFGYLTRSFWYRGRTGYDPFLGQRIGERRD